MLAVTRTCLGAACPKGDPDALFKKLTGIKVIGAQVISDDDARAVNDALVATVRCNAENAAKKIVIPAVVIAGLAAIGAGMFAWRAARHHPEALGRSRRALGTRYRVTVRYRKFPTPTSLCVEAPNKAEAVALVAGGAKGVKIVRVARGC
jgi:hypothetical protein